MEKKDRIDTLKTEYIKTDRYAIPYLFYATGIEEKVLIISHGFTSSKESFTSRLFFEELPDRGCAVLAYDFPAHGESKVDGESLSVGNCIADLKEMENLVHERLPRAEIYYLGSSFGAYITLQYIAAEQHLGTKAFLRSAAVNMPDLFKNLTEPLQKSMDERGYVVWDADRPVKVTSEFVKDLAAHELEITYRENNTKVEMIHGEADDLIIPEAAKEFADRFDIPITMVKGGEHRLMEKGQPKLVLKLACSMFGV